MILYDGETGGNTGYIRYRARAGKEYPLTAGATINAPVTAPKVEMTSLQALDHRGR